MPPSFFHRDGQPALAYRPQSGTNHDLPAVVFLTGFKSDMAGTKAEFLAHHCAALGQSYLRFDYRGHGLSEGLFEEGTIGLWFRDAMDIIAAKTAGPLILVGSSMGGWIGLLCARALKDRASGFIGLAAAPDFTRDITSKLSAAQKAVLANDGVVHIPNEYGQPYVITQALLEDGEDHCLLDSAIDINCPVRLIQGMKDTDVPWPTAQRIADAVTGYDVKIYLQEDGNHRLSAEDDLALLASLVTELSAFKAACI